MKARCRFWLPLALAWQSITLIAHAASNVLPSQPFPATWQAKLDEFTKGLAPGVVAIVKSPNWGVRVGTSGVANLATGAKPSPTMPFRVGSVTKSFTAQTVLQLEQQGKIRLTDPILKFLGASPVVSAIPNIAKVTIGDCLQMKTGILGYLANTNLLNTQFVSPLKHYVPEQLLAVLAPDAVPKLEPKFVPGDWVPNPYAVTENPKNQTNSVQTLYNVWPQYFTNRADPYWIPAWDYSNSNYTLLGMLIEKVTGLPLAEAIRTMICAKIGLTDTFLANDGTVPVNMMRGYTKFNAEQDKQIYTDWHDMTDADPSYAGAAGAIISTPWDLLHYLETIFKTDVFLNAGTKDKWLSFVSADSHWAGNDYGVGGIIQAHRTYGDARGHGGFFYGYKTLIYYYPDSDISFVLSLNTTDNGEMEVDIMDAILPLVKSSAMAPQPANNATMTLPVNTNQVQLAWQAGRVYGDSYNVYWGPDANSVDTATATSHAGVNMVTTTNLTVAIGGQKTGATNYWRVDTIAGTNTVTGSPWLFKIADPSAPQTLSVTLSWVGSPGIGLQKKSALDNQAWQDVPNTDGKSTANLPATEPQSFFQLNKR